MTTAEPTRGPTLAEKIDRLFAGRRTPDGGEHTYEEVATGIRSRGRTTISASYICQLRLGVKDNPRMKHLAALADFFAVPVNYFFDEDPDGARLYEQLAMLPVYEDAEVRHIALRAVDLSPESLKIVAQIVEHARQIERLHERERRPRTTEAVAEAEARQ